MKVEDLGFITSIKSFEENSLLVKILSKENGLISGYVMHIKKDRINYQIGNLVKFTWSAKNNNQLGNLKIELIKSYLSHFITNKFYLSLIDNINLLINSLLYERFLEKNLYSIIQVIFDLIAHNEEKYKILKTYFIFENTILNIVGSGIIFEKDTDINDFYYISPKTGLAVSKQKGEPYKNMLLLFPKIFQNDNIAKEDIIQCFSVINFFLKKYLLNNNLNNKYKIIFNSRDNILNSI